PAVEKNGVKLVSGAGYNSGFIAGRERYNYKAHIPKGMAEKRNRIAAIAKKHGIDIITAALHFVLAADAFAAIIPGSSTTKQVSDNVNAYNTKVPVAFWQELKDEKLIYEKAQTP